jgi:hypothetical protein
MISVPEVDNRAHGETNILKKVLSTMIYCKNFCKCHNVPQYNNNGGVREGWREGEK